jgi:hypothetical protein
MRYRNQQSVGRALKPQHGRVPSRTDRRRGVLSNQRVRGVPRNEQLPFVPPEDWYDPLENGARYRVIVQDPGIGFRHILTPSEIRARLAQLPAHFLKDLEVVQLSQMTRKKHSFPCYGMQWGASLYLYPIEDNLIEYYNCPPTPNQVNEARMYGGHWEQEARDTWKLVWSELAVRDFYLNNILIHELGHLVDARNTRYIDRERYAEWFAVEYGYRASKRLDVSPRVQIRRHHRV